MTETVELVGKKKTPMNQRVIVLMSKEEKTKLTDACYLLGKKLKSKISIGELVRYAIFNSYLPEALKKAGLKD